MRLTAIALVLIAAGTRFASAGGQQFGDWVVDVSSDKARIYAATVNDSGTVLGEFCNLSTHTCNWVLGMDISCEGSADSPVLGNTASGAVQLTVRCGGKLPSGNFYQYFFSDWKDLELLLKDSSVVGFAFPMKDGQFKVSRFSLTGRTDAMELAENLSLNPSVPKSKATQSLTGDSTL